MKKQIKRFGGSLAITFNRDEIQWYNLHEKDWINIGSLIKLQKKEVKDDNRKTNKRK